MQKFGENGNEFWWNNDEEDTRAIIIAVLFFFGAIAMLRSANVPLTDLVLIVGFMILSVLTVGKCIYDRKKNIPTLYMNEQGIEIRGSHIEWDWITKIEIKRIKGGRYSIAGYQIHITFYKPARKRKHIAYFVVDKSEVGEIKDYIEAFWNYFKTM